MIGLPEIPRTVANLVLEYDERIRAVFNYSHLRDFLSGDKNAAPFCLLTDDRVYVYLDTDKKLPRVTVADVEEVDSVESHSILKMKSNKLAFILIAFAMILEILLIVFSKAIVSGFNINAKILLLASILLKGIGLVGLIFCMILFVKHIIKLKRKSINFMLCVKFTDGSIIHVPIIKSTGGEETKKFATAVLSAKSAKRADIPDAFLL